jgi:hypothetical protein
LRTTKLFSQEARTLNPDQPRIPLQQPGQVRDIGAKLLDRQSAPEFDNS